MPGISDSPAPAINTAPLAALGSEQPATPAINDFMQAFRSGFLTVDDITRRTKQGAADTSNLRTTLDVNDLQRRKTAAEGELLPGQLAEAKTQQEIQAATAPARTAGATDAARRAQLAISDPDAFDAENADRMMHSQYSEIFGKVPENLRVKNPEKPLSIDEWTKTVWSPQIRAELQNLKTGYPLNSPEDNQARAEWINARENDLQTKGPGLYAQYRKDNETILAPKGSEPYEEALRDRVQEAHDKLIIKGARVKALPTILEANAKAGAEAPGKARAEALANRKDYSALDEIQALRKVDASYNKIQVALSKAQTPYEDMSAIFGFMKVLDPGSTVREGEYATAENARAIPETIANFYNKVVAGTKLTPEQRKQLLGAAEGAFKGQVQTAVPRIKQYQELEKQIGAEPGEVVPLEDVALLSKFGAAPTASTPPPQGMTKKIIQDGKTYQWNGTTYVETAP